MKKENKNKEKNSPIIWGQTGRNVHSIKDSQPFINSNEMGAIETHITPTDTYLDYER